MNLEDNIPQDNVPLKVNRAIELLRLIDKSANMYTPGPWLAKSLSLKKLPALYKVTAPLVKARILGVYSSFGYYRIRTTTYEELHKIYYPQFRRKKSPLGRIRIKV